MQNKSLTKLSAIIFMASLMMCPPMYPMLDTPLLTSEVTNSPIEETETTQETVFHEIETAIKAKIETGLSFENAHFWALNNWFHKRNQLQQVLDELDWFDRQTKGPGSIIVTTFICCHSSFYDMMDRYKELEIYAKAERQRLGYELIAIMSIPIDDNTISLI